MNERLSGIDVFVTVVEAGNFALAAQRLDVTRSAVAKSVARLETRVGARLFHRTTRSQSLTDDGQSYYESCRRALAELDAADAAFEAGRQAPAGRVRMTMPTLLGRACVAPLLFELGHRHPLLRFEVVLSDRRADLIEDGIDLALRSGRLDDSSALSARALGRQWMGFYATPAYLARRGRPSDMPALLAQRDAHDFVGYARQGRQQPWLFNDERGAEARFLPPARVVFDDIGVMTAAAADGLGIARLPTWLAAAPVAAGTLVKVFDDPRPYGYPLHALWLRHRALPLKMRVVIDHLAARLPPLLDIPAGTSAEHPG